MAIRVIDERDEQMVELIRDNDPFQLADTRLWQIYNLLPPETINTLDIPNTDRRVNRMPVKVIEEKAAPERMVKRGVVAQSSDYTEVVQAMRNAKPGQAFVVTLADPLLLQQKNCEVVFANMLRRQFAKSGLGLTAYKSAAKEVTIRKETALDVARRDRAPKKKGK